MKHYLCKKCINALMSYGEKIFVSPIDYFEFDELPTCEFCEGEEECNEIYEVQ